MALARTFSDSNGSVIFLRVRLMDGRASTCREYNANETGQMHLVRQAKTQIAGYFIPYTEYCKQRLARVL